MPIQIVDATIHQIAKAQDTQGAGCVTLSLRQEQLPSGPVLNRLCDSLIDIYRKNSNSNGTLGIDPNDHKFTFALKDYVEGRQDFIAFTHQAVDLIKDRMEQAFFSTGGFALFLRYTVDATDLLMVVMLKLKEGAGIDVATLNLTETLNIDTAHLHEAAKVNISRWQTQQEPHLTFIKGRAKKNDVSAYFREALACTAFTSSKHHTEAVIAAADAFIDGRDDVPAERKAKERVEMRQRLYECLVGAEDEVSLLAVAGAVHPGDPHAFVDHVKERAEAEGYHLDDVFKPHKDSVRRLRRLRARYGSISVAFDVGDVQQERVRYDSESRSLVLKDPPAHLIKSIQEHESAQQSP